MEENNIKGTHSIKFKLILIVVSMLLVSIAALTAISAYNTIHQGVSSANEINEAQAAIVEEQINGIMEENVRALNV